MTKVMFRTFGQIAAISKSNQMEVEFSGNSVREFLTALETELGREFRSILYPDNRNLSPMIYILVNGKNIQQLQELDTHLRDDDIVTILPVTAGG